MNEWMLSRAAACRASAAKGRKAVLDAGQYNGRFARPRFTMLPEARHDLAEMELSELEQALESLGHPRFHARQLFQWIHKRGVTDFAGMTDLGGNCAPRSPPAFRIVTPELVRKETSSDGTTKFLLRLEDGQLIESVYIPDTPANTSVSRPRSAAR